MARKCAKSVKGTELKVGDILLFPDPSEIVEIIPQRHPLGARYADVRTADGVCRQCWEGFLYRIEWDMPLDLSNATVTELATMP